MKILIIHDKRIACFGLLFWIILYLQLISLSPHKMAGGMRYLPITLVFSGRGYDEIIEGDSIQQGDYYYPNHTITADSASGDIVITGFQSDVGSVLTSIYLTSPFFEYESSSSNIIKWWPYWLNSNDLDLLFINQSFNVYLDEQSVQIIAFCYNFSSSPWEWEFSAIITHPLKTTLTPRDTEGWFIYGEHNGTTLQGQFTKRTLNLVFDRDGLLLSMNGASYFQVENKSYEYGFMWNRIALMDPPSSFWDFLFFPSNIVFGVIILIIILLGLMFTKLNRN